MNFSASANRAVPSALSDHRQIDETRRAPAMKDPLRSLAVVAGPGEENVRYVGLWVAVVEREPARLDLYHDAVARQKHMVHVRQCELVALHLARRNGAGMDQTLPVTSAENVHAEGKLVAAQRRIGRHLIRVHVDKLHDTSTVWGSARERRIDLSR